MLYISDSKINGGENMNISKQKIELIMAERGITREDLASLCGYSRTWLSTLLNKEKCQVSTALKLAEGLNVCVSDIAKEVD